MTSIPVLIFIEIVFVYLLFYRAGKQGINTLPIHILFLILLAWAAISAYLGWHGLYTTTGIKSWYPGYWLPLIPVVLVVTGMLFSRSVRRSLREVYLSAPVSWFVWIHAIRLAAIGGLYKATTGQFNERFAYSVGIPDFLFAVSAVIVGLLISRKGVNTRLLAIWNIVGAGVILLPMFGLMQWLVGEPEFYRLFEFPMSMAPTFIVPLLVMINAWSVWILLGRDKHE